MILCGYGIGPLYGSDVDPKLRTTRLFQLGTACLALLLVIRGFNIYGETLPWTTGETPVDTLMSMLNYTKYPPSLDFLLLTLGIAFLLMSWLDTRNNPATRVLQTFGQAPMFIYAFLSGATQFLEAVSKILSHENDDTTEINEDKRVLQFVFMSSYQSAKALQLGKQALDTPPFMVTA